MAGASAFRTSNFEFRTLNFELRTSNFELPPLDRLDDRRAAAANRGADERALLAAHDGADSRTGAGAAADDERGLLPRARSPLAAVVVRSAVVVRAAVRIGAGAGAV